MARQRAAGGDAPVPEQAARAYVREWSGLWARTAGLVRERREWGPADAVLVADYVEARRMAADHQALADAEPYVRGVGGRSFAHPGFERAAAARREARQVLAQLRLGVEAADVEPDEPEPEGESGPPSDQVGL